MYTSQMPLIKDQLFAFGIDELAFLLFACLLLVFNLISLSYLLPIC
jgi:hypothetical protein